VRQGQKWEDGEGKTGREQMDLGPDAIGKPNEQEANHSQECVDQRPKCVRLVNDEKKWRERMCSERKGTCHQREGECVRTGRERVSEERGDVSAKGDMSGMC
jgi:hypothetical protein